MNLKKAKRNNDTDLLKKLKTYLIRIKLKLMWESSYLSFLIRKRTETPVSKSSNEFYEVIHRLLPKKHLKDPVTMKQSRKSHSKNRVEL